MASVAHDTVGRNPAFTSTSWGKGSLSTIKGFIHCRWLFGISSINSMTLWCWGFGLTRGARWQVTMASGFHASLKAHGQFIVMNAIRLKIMINWSCRIITMLQWLRWKISGNHLPLVPFFLAPKRTRPVLIRALVSFGKDLKRPSHMLQDWKTERQG